MSRIAIPTPEATAARSTTMLDAVKTQLGVVPNLFRPMAASRAVLEGFQALNAALGKTQDVKTRNRIGDPPREIALFRGRARLPLACSAPFFPE